MAISTLVLAQKVWDDTPLINADFSILYPALTVKEINFLERKFLDLLSASAMALHLSRQAAGACEAPVIQRETSFQSAALR